MTNLISSVDDSNFAYHVLRYTSDLVRDEWVNIGVIVFDPLTGALRLRLVEEQDEYARIRRLQPAAHEDVLRSFRDHLEDQFSTYLRNRRGHLGATPPRGRQTPQIIRIREHNLPPHLPLPTHTQPSPTPLHHNH